MRAGRALAILRCVPFLARRAPLRPASLDRPQCAPPALPHTRPNGQNAHRPNRAMGGCDAKTCPLGAAKGLVEWVRGVRVAYGLRRLRFALRTVRVACAGLAACRRICRMPEKMRVANGLVRGRFERWAATDSPDAQNGKSDLPMAPGLNGASAPGFRKSFASGVFSGDGRFDSLSSGKRPAKRRRPAGFRRASARNPTGRMLPTVGDRWLRAVGRGPRTARCTPRRTSACGMQPGRAARYERRARYGVRSLTPRSSCRRARCGSRRGSP